MDMSLKPDIMKDFARDVSLHVIRLRHAEDVLSSPSPTRESLNLNIITPMAIKSYSRMSLAE